jgi:hypothetical protein
MNVNDRAFLHCLLIYEQQNDQIFSVLPEKRVEILKKELKKFERYPKGVRLNLISSMLGYLVQQVRHPHLEMVHPSWIADSLKKENPQTIAAILGQFTAEFKQQVWTLLNQIEPPSSSAVESASRESMDAITLIFSRRFVSMSPPIGEPEISVETIYLLKEEDLIVLMKQIGIREMSRSFAIVGNDVLAALISRFPESMRADFLNGIKTAKGESQEKQKIATKRLSKYDLASIPLEEAALKVGLSKLGSIVKRKRDVARRIAQRIPIDLGMIILQAEAEDAAVEPEQEEVISTMRNLISKQKILFASAEGDSRSKIDKAKPGFDDTR